MDTPPNAPEILVVEDNSDDVFFLQRVLKKADVEAPSFILSDGERAIDFLQKILPKPELHPRVVLLDLNLPRVNGFELMTWIRAQPQLSSLKLVVMTSSADDRDVQKAYANGANAYLLKYPSTDELRQLLVSLGVKTRAPNGSPKT